MGKDTFIIARVGSSQITDWEIGEEINIAAWDAEPDYRSFDLIMAQGRSVMVNSATKITIEILQASVTTDTE